MKEKAQREALEPICFSFSGFCRKVYMSAETRRYDDDDEIFFFFFLFVFGRYGKVFKSHIFGSPTIVSTDAEVSKFILQSDAKIFVPSYPKSLTELMGKSSILLINGSLQKRIHGLVGAFFKSAHLKVQITRDMQVYVQESMKKWNDHHPVYLQDETKNVSAHLLSLSVTQFCFLLFVLF